MLQLQAVGIGSWPDAEELLLGDVHVDDFGGWTAKEIVGCLFFVVDGEEAGLEDGEAGDVGGAGDEIGDGRIGIDEDCLAGADGGGEPADQFGAAGIGADAADGGVDLFAGGALDDGTKQEDTGDGTNGEDGPAGALEERRGDGVEERDSKYEVADIEAGGDASDHGKAADAEIDEIFVPVFEDKDAAEGREPDGERHAGDDKGADGVIEGAGGTIEKGGISADDGTVAHGVGVGVVIFRPEEIFDKAGERTGEIEGGESGNAAGSATGDDAPRGLADEEGGADAGDSGDGKDGRGPDGEGEEETAEEGAGAPDGQDAEDGIGIGVPAMVVGHHGGVRGVEGEEDGGADAGRGGVGELARDEVDDGGEGGDLNGENDVGDGEGDAEEFEYNGEKPERSGAGDAEQVPIEHFAFGDPGAEGKVDAFVVDEDKAIAGEPPHEGESEGEDEDNGMCRAQGRHERLSDVLLPVFSTLCYVGS